MRNFILLVMVLLAGFPVLAQDIRERLRGVSAGAHQGGVFHLNPNTIKRFKRAERDGVQIMELDLRLTKDGEVVVFHDAKMNLLTNCKGPLEDKTLQEVRACKFKLNREKIPTFREVLGWANGRLVINAEFKTREVAIPAVRLVRELGALEWVFFQTKSDPDRYWLARNFDSRVALLYVPKTEEDLNWAISLNDDRLIVIELHENLRRPEIIEAIHEAGKLALEDSWRYVWHQELLEAACLKVFDLGIDIAISNNPRSCAKQAAKANKQ